MLPVIKRQNIYEQVVEHLKQYVTDNGLRPGDRLPTEVELATRFRVSRQSVREAVKVLESMGLVETRTHHGSRLREANISHMTEHLRFMFELNGATFNEIAITRTVIECAFIPSIAQCADESDFERMEAAIARMRENSDNLDGRLQADMEFHQALVAATKNRMMAGFGVMLQGFFTKMRNDKETVVSRDVKDIREHEEIVAALRKRDAKTAGKLMHVHLSTYDLPVPLCPENDAAGDESPQKP